MNRPLITIAMISVAIGRCPAQEADRESEALDCGTQALYAMLRLERGEVDVDAVRASLPARPPSGYTMRHLRDAASARGLTLVGVKLPSGDRAPDRPALAFLKVAPHGHYVVLRPVGQSGRLVQVIDSAKRHPEVLDADLLYRSPSWTGLALVPRRPNWPLRLAVAAAGAGALFACGLRMRKRLAASTIAP